VSPHQTLAQLCIRATFGYFKRGLETSASTEVACYLSLNAAGHLQTHNFSDLHLDNLTTSSVLVYFTPRLSQRTTGYRTNHTTNPPPLSERVKGTFLRIGTVARSVILELDGLASTASNPTLSVSYVLPTHFRLPVNFPTLSVALFVFRFENFAFPIVNDTAGLPPKFF